VAKTAPKDLAKGKQYPGGVLERKDRFPIVPGCICTINNISLKYTNDSPDN